MKQAVIFDLLGTLLIAKVIRPLSSMYEILKEHGLSSTLDEFTIIWEKEKSIPSQKHHTPFEERISRVSYKLDWKLDWNYIDIIANDICDKAATIVSIDNDALGLLRRLQSRVKLGLVTNYDHPPAIYKMIESTKLVDFFSTVVISGEIGIWKPDPRILQAAIERLSLQSSDCIYVGDSAVDIEVAISAGVDPILIVREDNQIDPFRNPENDIEKEYQILIKSNKLRVIGKISEVEGLL
jgi:HAD superfamily hydrolase (TIGR01509 family)